MATMPDGKARVTFINCSKRYIDIASSTDKNGNQKSYNNFTLGIPNGDCIHTYNKKSEDYWVSVDNFWDWGSRNIVEKVGSGRRWHQAELIDNSKSIGKDYINEQGIDKQIYQDYVKYYQFKFKDESIANNIYLTKLKLTEKQNNTGLAYLGIVTGEQDWYGDGNGNELGGYVVLFPINFATIGDLYCKADYLNTENYNGTWYYYNGSCITKDKVNKVKNDLSEINIANNLEYTTDTLDTNTIINYDFVSKKVNVYDSNKVKLQFNNDKINAANVRWGYNEEDIPDQHILQSYNIKNQKYLVLTDNKPDSPTYNTNSSRFTEKYSDFNDDVLNSISAWMNNCGWTNIFNNASTKQEACKKRYQLLCQQCEKLGLVPVYNGGAALEQKIVGSENIAPYACKYGYEKSAWTPNTSVTLKINNKYYDPELISTLYNSFYCNIIKGSVEEVQLSTNKQELYSGYWCKNELSDEYPTFNLNYKQTGLFNNEGTIVFDEPCEYTVIIYTNIDNNYSTDTPSKKIPEKNCLNDADTLQQISIKIDPYNCNSYQWRQLYIDTIIYPITVGNNNDGTPKYLKAKIANGIFIGLSSISYNYFSWRTDRYSDISYLKMNTSKFTSRIPAGAKLVVCSTSERWMSNVVENKQKGAEDNSFSINLKSLGSYNNDEANSYVYKISAWDYNGSENSTNYTTTNNIINLYLNTEETDNTDNMYISDDIVLDTHTKDDVLKWQIYAPFKYSFYIDGDSTEPTEPDEPTEPGTEPVEPDEPIQENMEYNTDNDNNDSGLDDPYDDFSDYYTTPEPPTYCFSIEYAEGCSVSLINEYYIEGYNVYNYIIGSIVVYDNYKLPSESSITINGETGYCELTDIYNYYDYSIDSYVFNANIKIKNAWSIKNPDNLINIKCEAAPTHNFICNDGKILASSTATEKNECCYYSVTGYTPNYNYVDFIDINSIIFTMSIPNDFILPASIKTDIDTNVNNFLLMDVQDDNTAQVKVNPDYIDNFYKEKFGINDTINIDNIIYNVIYDNTYSLTEIEHKETDKIYLVKIENVSNLYNGYIYDESDNTFNMIDIQYYIYENSRIINAPLYISYKDIVSRNTNISNYQNTVVILKIGDGIYNTYRYCKETNKWIDSNTLYNKYKDKWSFYELGKRDNDLDIKILTVVDNNPTVNFTFVTKDVTRLFELTKAISNNNIYYYTDFTYNPAIDNVNEIQYKSSIHDNKWYTGITIYINSPSKYPSNDYKSLDEFVCWEVYYMKYDDYKQNIENVKPNIIIQSNVTSITFDKKQLDIVLTMKCKKSSKIRDFIPDNIGVAFINNTKTRKIFVNNATYNNNVTDYGDSLGIGCCDSLDTQIVYNNISGEIIYPKYTDISNGKYFTYGYENARWKNGTTIIVESPDSLRQDPRTIRIKNIHTEVNPYYMDGLPSDEDKENNMFYDSIKKFKCWRIYKTHYDNVINKKNTDYIEFTDNPLKITLYSKQVSDYTIELIESEETIHIPNFVIEKQKDGNTVLLDNNEYRYPTCISNDKRMSLYFGGYNNISKNIFKGIIQILKVEEPNGRIIEYENLLFDYYNNEYTYTKPYITFGLNNVGWLAGSKVFIKIYNYTSNKNVTSATLCSNVNYIYTEEVASINGDFYNEFVNNISKTVSNKIYTVNGEGQTIIQFPNISQSYSVYALGGDETIDIKYNQIYNDDIKTAINAAKNESYTAYANIYDYYKLISSGSYNIYKYPLSYKLMPVKLGTQTPVSLNENYTIDFDKSVININNVIENTNITTIKKTNTVDLSNLTAEQKTYRNNLISNLFNELYANNKNNLSPEQLINQAKIFANMLIQNMSF